MSITLVGRIEVDGTWRIKGRLYYNGKTYPNEIEFLIDTGAKSTVLSDKDAKRMDLGYHTIKAKEKQMGGAGSCMGHPLFNAGIVFSENGELKDPELCRDTCQIQKTTSRAAI